MENASINVVCFIDGILFAYCCLMLYKVPFIEKMIRRIKTIFTKKKPIVLVSKAKKIEYNDFSLKVIKGFAEQPTKE